MFQRFYNHVLYVLSHSTSVRIVQKERGRNFSLGREVERRGGGSKFFFRWGLRDEVGVEISFDTGLKKRWGRILSSVIEERGS